MGTSYDLDYAAWAFEQVDLLRAGRFDDIDGVHIAEEIEDVGKAEYRALRSRMAILIEYLLKWHLEPERLGKSWRTTIFDQREAIGDLLAESPSLRRMFDDEEWLTGIWRHGQCNAQQRSGIDMPGHWLWTVQQVLDEDFLPD